MIESEVVHATPTSSGACKERAQVERLLADPLFSQSKRCAAFLRYVTERALSHSREPLTERSLGVEVFGRAPSYDTDADPIVRVTASEVRKRLAQYYDEPAHSGEIRVVVHKGSYAAEFVTHEASVFAAPVRAEATQVAAEPKRNMPRWYFLAAGLAGLGLMAIVVVQVVAPRSSLSDLFWAPIANGPRDVILSVPQFSDHVKLEGAESAQLTWTDSLTPVPDKMEVGWAQYSRTLVHIWDVRVASRLSEFLGSKGKHIVVKGEHDLTMNDLRETPAVILGGLTNQWTSRLAPRARFSFDGEGTERFIRDRQNPGSRQWKFDAKVPSGNRDKDFIIISRVADSASGRITVLAGGFSAWGTEAAVALLTDPSQMQSVLARAPQRWDARNVQIVLECTVVARQAGNPRFLAAHSW